MSMKVTADFGSSRLYRHSYVQHFFLFYIYLSYFEATNLTVTIVSDPNPPVISRVKLYSIRTKYYILYIYTTYIIYFGG